jgi:hypothetical protein
MSELARTSRTVETLITRIKNRFLDNPVLCKVTIVDGWQNAQLEGAPPRICLIVGDPTLVFANLCKAEKAFATIVEVLEVYAWGLESQGDFDQNARIPAIELIKDVAACAHLEYGANVTGGPIEQARETHVTKYGEYLLLKLSVQCPVYLVDPSVPAQVAGGTNGVIQCPSPR